MSKRIRRSTECIIIREATEKVLAENYEDGKNYGTMASNFKTIDEYLGDRKVDQTAQGVRLKGEFDTNLMFSLGGTIRY